MRTWHLSIVKSKHKKMFNNCHAVTTKNNNWIWGETKFLNPWIKKVLPIQHNEHGPSAIRRHSIVAFQLKLLAIGWAPHLFVLMTRQATVQREWHHCQGAPRGNRSVHAGPTKVEFLFGEILKLTINICAFLRFQYYLEKFECCVEPFQNF